MAGKIERIGKTWKVDNFVDNKTVIVEDTNPKQQIHIFHCENSTVQIKGRVNEILIDNCNKVSVLFEDAIASCDVVNSKRTTIQVTGVVSSFQVDRSSGVTIYLSHASESARIFTSCAMEVNVVTSPPANVDEPQVDHAVPQQYVSYLRNGKLVTEPIQHASA